MSPLETTAPAFVDMAHRIVWCTVATVASDGHPRTRVLHPIWEWDGTDLVGWIATAPTPIKVDAIDHEPTVSLTYWDQSHDTCSADCRAEWRSDIDTRRMVWDKFVNAPAPVGYDPSMIPGWDGPDSDFFSVLRLDPYRVRVFPGSVLLEGTGDVLHWRG